MMERNRPRIKPRIHEWLMAEVNALRESQVKGGDELSALMPSVLDKAFKGEL